jgi:hypothetical protein
MKKILLVALLVTTTLTSFAQNTIKFLGIPITGSKKEMISKLEAKGYEYNSYTDVLTGEFNGHNVNISVQTVNNRVWRIAIVDATGTDETNIKIRYNNLFDQFVNNGKYVSVGEGKLSDNDDISYEMTVHKKRYEADFYFLDKSINGQVWYMIAEQFGNYKIIMFYENLDNAANGDDL